MPLLFTKYIHLYTRAYNAQLKHSLRHNFCWNHQTDYEQYQYV